MNWLLFHQVLTTAEVPGEIRVLKCAPGLLQWESNPRPFILRSVTMHCRSILSVGLPISVLSCQGKYGFCRIEPLTIRSDVTFLSLFLFSMSYFLVLKCAQGFHHGNLTLDPTFSNQFPIFLSPIFLVLKCAQGFHNGNLTLDPSFSYHCPILLSAPHVTWPRPAESPSCRYWSSWKTPF
jgi:hypothetical protein